MSTRCCVQVKQTFGEEQDADKEVRSVMIYHHWDGYPSGVGYDLWQRLRKYKGNWDIDEVVNGLLKDPNDSYEYTAFNHTDIDYLYVIDCSAKTLKCYECEWVFQDEDGRVVDESRIIKEVKLNFKKEAKNDRTV